MKPAGRRVYGWHAAESVLANSPATVSAAFVDRQRRDPRVGEIVRVLEQHGVTVEPVMRAQLDLLAAGGNHQGVILEVRLPAERTEDQLADALARAVNPLLLVLDRVQDPHNLGACLRTADAAGVLGVVVPKDQSVGLTPTVAKVASGAAETVPLYQVTNLSRCLDRLKRAGLWIAGAAGGADHSIYEADLTGPLAVVLGAEGQGLRRLTREHCDYLVRIPMSGAVDSLNVSVAAGILLYEAVRQRGHHSSS